MATANIRAVITAEDRGSAVVKNFGNSVGKSSNNIANANKKTAASFNEVLVATAGTAVVAKSLIGFMGETVKSANREQAALTGLTSITRAFKQDTEEALEAAKGLAEDGLMTVGDAAMGLKNLLAAGFNLDQAIKLMDRFKDSAAFGKQGALEFGQAIVGATEGIKNGNSILVDNAGVTKNLSVILEEAGFSAQDLMRATTDASVRQAIFNGIIKETNPMVGDAAKLTELFAGKQAKLDAQTEILKARIGEALQPALISLLEAITPVVEAFSRFAIDNPKVVAAFLLITTVTVSLIAVLGSLGLAVMGLKPIFAGFAVAAKGSIAGVKVAFVGLRTLLMTPIALPAIAIGAALAAIWKVRDEGRKLQKELDAATQSISSFGDAKADFIASLGKAKSEGRISQTEYNRRLNAYTAGLPTHLRASGGSVNAGQPYMVGENGPELFTPSNAGVVSKNSESGGATYNFNVTVGMYAGTEREKRKIAEQLAQAYKDATNSSMAWSR